MYGGWTSRASTPTRTSPRPTIPAAGSGPATASGTHIFPSVLPTSPFPRTSSKWAALPQHRRCEIFVEIRPFKFQLRQERHSLPESFLDGPENVTVIVLDLKFLQ